jgi:hypothetical protein
MPFIWLHGRLYGLELITNAASIAKYSYYARNLHLSFVLGLLVNVLRRLSVAELVFSSERTHPIPSAIVLQSNNPC